jgi:UDP-2-acetamido-3-amino-2,3-dideoxy-glucuronate N-acetyltransferase
MSDLLDGCELHHLRSVLNPNGLLVVNAQLCEPFPIKRVFTVLADSGALRGQHAHRTCSQFLMAPTGEIVVTVTDGAVSREYRLDRPTMGLLVPPMVWAREYFVSTTSSLLVLCDHEYEEADYIREWDRYLALLATKSGASR